MKVSKKQLLLFRIIALLLPVLILVVLEIILRLCNYGYDYSLFKQDGKDKDYLVMNPDASKKYFQSQSIAPTGNRELFKKVKDSNTIRIFVLGESTTIGYPYFHNGSFHRFLLYRLMHTMPDKNFEIINVSLTAVNSYTVLGFAKQVINYQPNAVLIYTGHNEYYGALGIGSTQRLGSNRFLVNTVLFLRDFKIIQLISNTYKRLASLFSKQEAVPAKDRMELMAADQQIRYGSKKFFKGIEQFKTNMDETLRIFNQHHISVFVSNLVSNEKNIPPFISELADSLHANNFKKDFQYGEQALNQKNYPLAISYFNTANQIYSNSADCNYYLGESYLKKGSTIEAKKCFNAAEDLDMLRFRAPHQINDIIDSLCKKYSYVHLVDTKSLFEKNSEDNIMGDELILEHVHPNLKGYALLSEAFYKIMEKQGVIKVKPQDEMSFDELVQTMPVTIVDSLVGAYKIFNLKRMWPFVKDGIVKKDTLKVASEEEQLAYNIAFNHEPWAQSTSDLYDYYIHQPNLEKAKKVMEALVLEYPTNEFFYEKAANICGKLEDNKNAVLYFTKAFNLDATFESARYILVLYLKLDEPEKALSYINYAIQNNSSSGFELSSLKKATNEVIQLKQAAGKGSSNKQLLNQIAYAYYSMGNKEGAGKYVEKVLKIDANDGDALSLLSKLKMQP